MDRAADRIAADLETAVRTTLGAVHDVEHSAGALRAWAERARTVVRGYTVDGVELALRGVHIVRVEGDGATVVIDGTRIFDVTVGAATTVMPVEISGPATLIRDDQGWKLADHTIEGRLLSELVTPIDATGAEVGGVGARVETVVEAGGDARIDVLVANTRSEAVELGRAWFGRRTIAWIEWSPVFVPAVSVPPGEERIVELARHWQPDRRGRAVTPEILLELGERGVVRLAGDGSRARALARLPLLARHPGHPWWVQLVLLTAVGAWVAGLVGAGAILTTLCLLSLVSLRGRLPARSRLVVVLALLAVIGLVLVAVGITRRADEGSRLAADAADARVAELFTAEHPDLAASDRDAAVEELVATRERVDAGRWCARARPSQGTSDWREGPCLRYVEAGGADYVFATYELPEIGWVALLTG